MPSFPSIRLARGFAVLLAAAVLAVPARAQDDETAPAAATATDCPLRYQSSLKAIEAKEFAGLNDAVRGRSAAGAMAEPVGGDPSLPGTLLFVSQPRPRSPAEISALTAGVALARSKGRSASVASHDSEWIATRLRDDLGDYLGQKPTPYLCNGIPEYLKTLRSFAVRLGPSEDRRREWIETQRASTGRSIAAAFATIGEAGAKAQAGAQAQGNEPPGAPAPRIETAEDLASAVDRLTGAIRSAGLLTEPDGVPAITNGIATPLPLANPVLAKLSAAKPYVVSARPMIRDRTTRLKVLAAFADIEMLDYLVEAKALPANPVASAFDATLKAIESAEAKDCTCGP